MDDAEFQKRRRLLAAEVIEIAEASVKCVVPEEIDLKALDRLIEKNHKLLCQIDRLIRDHEGSGRLH